MTMLIGLDLSRRAAAAVAVPTEWDGDWTRVASYQCGGRLQANSTEEERIRLCDTIAQRIGSFCQRVYAEHIWIESYAWGTGTSAYTLGEVGGIVRLELMRHKLEINVANMGTARKLLLGKVPRGKGLAKKAVQKTLGLAGAPGNWTADHFDAFTVVNFALSNYSGAYCFAQEAAGGSMRTTNEPSHPLEQVKLVGTVPLEGGAELRVSITSNPGVLDVRYYYQAAPGIMSWTPHAFPVKVSELGDVAVALKRIAGFAERAGL